MRVEAIQGCRRRIRVRGERNGNQGLGDGWVIYITGAVVVAVVVTALHIYI